MKKLIDFLLQQHIDIYKEDIQFSCPDESISLFTKWQWDYELSLHFQKICLQYIQSNPSHKIIICCNHPPTYTMGHGLQKHTIKENNLQDISETDLAQLSFPLVRIKRGGGITFHHPGQWIIYVINKLNNRWTLKRHFNWLLNSVTQCLNKEFSIADATTNTNLAGVWCQNRKLASIGIGVEKFVTLHGLALNVHQNKKMLSELQRINPCGLNAKTYQYLEELVPTNNLLLQFHKSITTKNYLFPSQPN